MKAYRRKSASGHDAIFTVAKVENGVVVDAYVDQVGGNATGYAGNHIGKTEEQIKAEGFKYAGKVTPRP